jgi:Protein of unknown function (DUF2891)
MSWVELEQAREELLHTLAPPILSAVGNEDTPSPIFHGCFDWHSAVHGVYSLFAIHRRTGDDLYLEAARQHARPELVAAELAYMARDELELEENPYGFAWLLTLARAEELAAGTTDLRPLADRGLERITALITALDSERGFELATSDMHPNLPWALLHLAEWARHTGDDGQLEFAQDAARRHLLDPRLDDVLAVRLDAGEVIEFMAPGLMRLAALGAVLGEDAQEEIDRRLPAGFEVPPFTSPTTVHGGGVNFFRAFALLHLYRATGRPELLDNVASLVLYQAGRTDLWRGNDYQHRHWIAQIGVRVIDDSYGD